MLSFRQFEAGPDPFGRKFQVYFKWLQTAISIRHADTVDVKFILVDEAGIAVEKTIALPHANLIAAGKQVGRPLDDAWCARIAARHLLHLIATGDDIEKDLITLLPADLKRHAEEVTREEKKELSAA